MAPPTLLTPLPPGAPPPPMPRPSAAALAAYRPDVPVLAPLPQYAPLPEIVRAPPPPCKFWSAPGGCRNGSACRFAHPVAGRASSYAPPPRYVAPPRPAYAPPPPRPAPPPRPPPPQKFSNDGSFLEAMKRKLAAPAPAAEEAAPPPAKRQASAAAKARRMKKKAEAPPAAAPRGSGSTKPVALALSTLDDDDDIAPLGYDGDGARRGEEALWSAKAEAAALKEATRRARCALRRAEAPPARDASPS